MRPLIIILYSFHTDTTTDPVQCAEQLRDCLLISDGRSLNSAGVSLHKARCQQVFPAQKIVIKLLVKTSHQPAKKTVFHG